LTSHGYGFIDRKEGSVFINAREARKAFDGDIVEVVLIDTGHASGPEGEILSVDASQRRACLAQLRKRQGEWLADIKTGQLLFTAKVESQRPELKIQSGDWALVEVKGTRRRNPLPGCRIVDVLGDPNEKGVVENGLIASFGLDDSYPEDAIKEASKIKAVSTHKGVRRDLRDELVLTIDPADAKDNDDAVSLKLDSDGNYLLGIHIADVSQYVLFDSLTDREAKRRGFSIYLQHHYFPMLPPRLPDKLCSLKPGRDRLALSVLLKIDQKGRVLKREITPSLIRVKKLLSYKTAQQLIDKPESADRSVGQSLARMWKLAKLLKSRRLSDGGVELDLPEIGFEWNKSGALVKIFQQPRLDSHQLIEEFMLAANRSVAEIWMEKFGAKAPNLYRVHEPPDAEKRQKLSDYLADAGFEWAAEKLTTAKQLSLMLDEARRRFPLEVTSISARKALMLAQYSEKPKGHFGLGFKKYLHFTSPIRRYSDLMVHRLIWKHIVKDHSFDKRVDAKNGLEEICEALNARERLISEVEREANKLAGLLYLNAHRDKIYKACVVEAVRDNIFVTIEDIFIEGFLVEDCGVIFKSRRESSDRYKKRIKGESTVSIGDKIDVTIDRIDLLNRKLELRPV